jgi:hypothetical protein
MTDEHSFYLCLSHDVDRVRKTFQSLYYAVTKRNLHHLRTAVSDEEPYWQFEEIMALESDLGVRSSFYFLNEQRLFRDRSPREWLTPQAWQLYAGRYDVTDPVVADVVCDLDKGGWEVGLHGSYESYDDQERLADEKATLESVLSHEVRGVRQHYLNLSRPETWRHHAALGLDYDASIGSSSEYGFRHGHGVHRPFNDDFVVFPLTVMEVALLEDRDLVAAKRECDRLLDEAAAEGAVMTVLWHPRYFNDREFPGYRRLYRRFVEGALDRSAWVGPLGEMYEKLERDDDGPP